MGEAHRARVVITIPHPTGAALCCGRILPLAADSGEVCCVRGRVAVSLFSWDSDEPFWLGAEDQRYRWPDDLMLCEILPDTALAFVLYD